jgi:nucleoredoxin
MKISRLLATVLMCCLVSATARAGFFDEIKGDLTDPAIKESPKYTALYFSAHWCPPCRLFTPKLVEWYKGFKATHPNFELVFVSGDRDEAAMKEYIKETGMPWPAVAFDKAESEAFQKFSSDGIPYLVLLDENGKPLTAKPGNEWQSPDEVLSEIEKLVPAGS